MIIIVYFFTFTLPVMLARYCRCLTLVKKRPLVSQRVGCDSIMDSRDNQIQKCHLSSLRTKEMWSFLLLLKRGLFQYWIASWVCFCVFQIKQAVEEVQKLLLEKDSRLSRALIPVGTLHITLLVTHLSTQEQLDLWEHTQTHTEILPHVFRFLVNNPELVLYMLCVQQVWKLTPNSRKGVKMCPCPIKLDLLQPSQTCWLWHCWIRFLVTRGLQCCAL